MIAELLELRAKFASGPVMPEVPSYDVLQHIRSSRAGYWTADFLYDDIRTALLEEQSR